MPTLDPTMVADIAAAFADGRLSVQVDAPRPMSRGLSMYVGERAIADGTPLRCVHVMSKPAGGEIRGYFLTPDGALRLRLPSRPEQWPELDAAVIARVDGALTAIGRHATGTYQVFRNGGADERPGRIVPAFDGAPVDASGWSAAEWQEYNATVERRLNAAATRRPARRRGG